MLQKYVKTNEIEDGKPAGGTVKGVGLEIEWQKGPLGRGRRKQDENGAFVETVISAACQRIEFYQESGFGCRENKNAIYYLNKALAELNARTQDREGQEVEGTHKRRRVM